VARRVDWLDRKVTDLVLGLRVPMWVGASASQR